MDTKDLRGLMEAYSSVYAPQEEINEGIKKIYHKIAAKHHERQADKAFEKGDSDKFQRHTGRSMVHRLDSGEKIAQVGNPEKFREYEKKMRTKKEELDIFDAVLEFLQVEGYAETLEEAEWIMANELNAEDIEEILEAEVSYGETPKAYSAASKTKMTAKRKPFLKAMLRRTNPANRKDAYGSPRKGLTADDRERARAGSAHGVGTRQDHDYPSQGPGGVTKNPKKLRKQKAMGEFAKEEFKLWLNSLVEEGYDLSDYTWDEMCDIYEEEQLNELSNRKMRAYIKKSSQSHQAINKKWDQGTATEKEKLKSIGHEFGQERAYRKMDKRAGR